MEIHSKKVNGVDVVHLSGRFDAYEAPHLARWYDEHTDTKHLVVNMSGVGFIDSSGISMLVKGLKRCRQNEGDLYISNLQQAVVIIFELIQLDKAFLIFADENDAVRAFQN